MALRKRRKCSALFLTAYDIKAGFILKELEGVLTAERTCHVSWKRKKRDEHQAQAKICERLRGPHRQPAGWALSPHTRRGQGCVSIIRGLGVFIDFHGAELRTVCNAPEVSTYYISASALPLARAREHPRAESKGGCLSVGLEAYRRATDWPEKEQTPPRPPCFSHIPTAHSR